MTQRSPALKDRQHSTPATVSTVIAAYNAERTIAETIDSALAQECDGHEVVVVNDGSTDSTATILSGYGDRIGIVTQPNRGAAAARNAGVAYSTGKYIAILDSDDLWVPGKLQTMIAALEHNAGASLAFSEYAKIDDDGVEFGQSMIGHAPTMNEMMRGLPPILTSTMVIPRQMFDRTGGFHEEFRGQGFEDSWLLLLLRELGEFEYLPAKLTRYRVSYDDEGADKYGRGLPTFVSLVKKRYRARGRRLIKSAKNLQCRWMLSKVAHQMDGRDRVGAAITLACIARLRPTYFLSSEFTERLLLPQNLKRLGDLSALVSRDGS